jgi:hypothetical protein
MYRNSNPHLSENPFSYIKWKEFVSTSTLGGLIDEIINL